MGLEISSATSPIVSSVNWIEQILLGGVATAIAAISVAALGAAILTGRASWRRGASVVVGCCIIFGASAMARGLTERSSDATSAGFTVSPVTAPIAPPQASAAYDPYAGAGLAVRPASKESLRERTSGEAPRRVPPGQNSRLDVPPAIH